VEKFFFGGPSKESVVSLEWVRAKNPSAYRRPIGFVDDDERLKRLEAIRAGVTIVGPL
jgi:hypothetical protein